MLGVIPGAIPWAPHSRHSSPFAVYSARNDTGGFMTNYRDFSEARAAAALQEYLDERGPALASLKSR